MKILQTPKKSVVGKFFKLPDAPKKENGRVPISNFQNTFKPTLNWDRDDVPEEVPRYD